MATYGYKREDGTYFAVEQSMKEYVALKECPETGQPCHRVYEPPTVEFLGAGWPGYEYSDKYTTLGEDKNGNLVIKS